MQKGVYDWRMRKAKGGDLNIAAREPWRTSRRPVECRQKCAAKRKKFEGGEVWEFIWRVRTVEGRKSCLALEFEVKRVREKEERG